CPASSRFVRCFRCEGTCTNPNPLCSTGPCQPGRCVCRSGFVRSGQRCISATSCPRRCSVQNQVFRTCATACEPTCRNQNP
ncbi:hypothetical protein PENTCL1PPCAC_16206, partial [Pristionchus entomophagus]